MADDQSRRPAQSQLRGLALIARQYRSVVRLVKYDIRLDALDVDSGITQHLLHVLLRIQISP